MDREEGNKKIKVIKIIHLIELYYDEKNITECCEKKAE